LLTGSRITDPEFAGCCGVKHEHNAKIREVRKAFFLKKEAKTLATRDARGPDANPMKAKVFWFFFPKKNRLLP
jgi:hypothetical protein